MNNLSKLFLILLFLVNIAAHSQANAFTKEEFLDQFRRAAEEELVLLEKQNRINDLNGKSNQNQYLVYINCATFSSASPWAGSISASLKDSELESLNSDIVRNFDKVYNKEGRKARFYVLYVDNFPVLIEKDTDIESYSDLRKKAPSHTKEIEEKATGAINAAISTIYSRVPELKEYENWVAYTIGTVVGVKNENGSEVTVAKHGFGYLASGGLSVEAKCYLHSIFSYSKISGNPFERLRIRVSDMQAGFSDILDLSPNFLEYKCGANPGNTILSRSFTDHAQHGGHGNSETMQRLINEITKELDKRHEALLKDYGKVQVEELSPIEKIFFLHGQELTEKNLNKYLTLLKAIEKGAIETEELIKNVDESNYEELQNISRLTDINIASMLSWEAREKLLTAWAEKDYLADNGWLGYDERKVIELLAKAPRADSEKLITFFKKNNHKYLLKFYGDLNDAGGIDHNTLFIETLVEVSKQLLEDKIATANGLTEAEKIFDLVEQGSIKGIFYSIPSSDCQPFDFSENSTTSYKVTSKWCYCSGSDLETQMPCEEKVLSSVDDMSPLDLAIIVKGKDLSVLRPEYYQGSEFRAEVVPAIYFKYGEKERSVEVAKNVGTGVFTVASFAIPGTLMVRAMIAGRYLVATFAAADLVANTLAEIANSAKFKTFIVGRYGTTNGTTFISVTQAISILTGNVTAPANTIKAANLAEEITKTTRTLSEVDLKTFVNISDDLASNAKTLIDKGEFTAEQLAEIKKTATFVREDLAKSGKTIGTGEQIAAGGKWLSQFEGLGLTDDLAKRLSKKFDDLGFSEAQVDGFVSDIAKGGEGFVSAIAKNEELVDSWSSFKKVGLDDLARNTDNLEALNKAMKQEGYGSEYFERLLKSKENPQKFIDDYVSKVGANGKFVDNALETEYSNYLVRKQRQGKPPRDRSDWKEASDYMKNNSPTARGNAFNDLGKLKYDINELNLKLPDGSNVRVDSYVPASQSPTGKGMIISRKATDLIDIEESTFRKHLQELKSKYAPGTLIRSDKFPRFDGQTIQGKQYLEIPESNKSFYDIERYKNIAEKEYGIELIFLAE